MTGLANFIDYKEMLVYTFIGACITLLDWLTFFISTKIFSVHYEIALILGFSVGTLIHYFSNKLITFKCKSKQIGLQLSIYSAVVLCSLCGNMMVIALIINLFGINHMMARILTTAMMVLPNYMVHKHLTYSKRIFTIRSYSAPPSTQPQHDSPPLDPLHDIPHPD